MLILTKKPDLLLDLTLTQYSIFKGDGMYDMVRETLYGIVTVEKLPTGKLKYSETKLSEIVIYCKLENGEYGKKKVFFHDVYERLCQLIFEKVNLKMEVNTYAEFHLEKLTKNAALYKCETL